MIDIAFCINDKFVIPTQVLIYSIIRNTNKKINFHIIYKSISKENIDKFIQFSNKFNTSIFFYNVSKYDFNNLIIRNGDRVTLETYFRFLLPEILPNISTVLYLDADMLCLNDISSIKEIDLTNIPVAMCYDQAYSHISNFNRLDYDLSFGYFNAGVMYINLDYWRKTNLSNELFSYVKNNPDKCLCHDQDAINAVLHGKIKILPIKYNFQHTFFKIYGWNNYKKYGKKYLNSDTIEKNKWNEILNDSKSPIFIHFSCPSKPWHKDSYTPFTNTWRIYYKKLFSKDFNPVSRYDSKLKQIKIILHNALAKMHLISKIEYPSYPEEAFLIEKEYLANHEI